MDPGIHFLRSSSRASKNKMPGPRAERRTRPAGSSEAGSRVYPHGIARRRQQGFSNHRNARPESSFPAQCHRLSFGVRNDRGTFAPEGLDLMTTWILKHNSM